jgi:hypothetical protein
MLGVRKAFQDSSVSYMILQEINYKSISCVCGGENGILNGWHPSFDEITGVAAGPSVEGTASKWWS